MWADLYSGFVENISDSSSSIVDLVKQSLIQKQESVSRDPEILRAAEPEKIRRVDGSTAVKSNSVKKQMQLIDGIDNKLLIFGGGFLAIGLIFVIRG